MITQLTKIAVIMGGMSSEREISLQTGQCVLEALVRDGYNAIGIDVTGDIKTFISVLEQEKPSVVFNALHGQYGEDGCIQGLLNLMGIPYTHSGVLASALAMDKDRMKQFVRSLDILTPNSVRITKKGILSGKGLSWPYVVKPNNGGSSIEVFIVTHFSEEQEMLSKLEEDTLYLMEEYIPGRELSVMVMDDGTSGIVELIPQQGFYDYTHKYQAHVTKHLIPAPIDPAWIDQLKKETFRIHTLAGCRGVTRSDYRYDDITDPTHPKAYFLELNTNPGMTQLSLVPEIAKSVGISYTDLILWLLKRAVCEN